jgi:hypothetical protein
MNTYRYPDGTVVVNVFKVGRFGNRRVSFCDAESGSPEWSESGDVIRFDGQDWTPVNQEAAAAWMAEFMHPRTNFDASGTVDTAIGKEAFLEDFGPIERRWQYATVNTGMFNTHARLASVLGEAGRLGRELVQVYDKSSNWIGGSEKGFLLLRRQVPAGVEPIAWSVQFSQTMTF